MQVQGRFRELEELFVSGADPVCVECDAPFEVKCEPAVSGNILPLLGAVGRFASLSSTSNSK